MKEEKVIGSKIRLARENKGYTQSQLAEMIDISIPHLSDIENGKKEMGIMIFKGLVNVLDLNANEILDAPAYKRDISNGYDFKMILDECTSDEADQLLRLMMYNKMAIKEINKKKKF